ncbi:Maf family protein [Pseudogracilibacillus sp. ICA-222130]|uniref:Maf family protein n=1 Tax=Pseudogracilibacillus sp. ICA-222130 TaxID=3134655 RepID=UPI0030C05A2E
MERKLILASSSPRRQQLLHQVQIPFTIRTNDVDESIVQEMDPIEKVKQLAILKGNSIQKNVHEVILAADTVVSFQGKIFEKPKDRMDARSMLTQLSGNTHEVYTGVYIKGVMENNLFVEKTEVTFWELTEEEIEHYIQLDDPYDKAGAYGIQSTGAILVKHIFGDYYNVVGLPLAKVVRALKTFHIYPS